MAFCTKCGGEAQRTDTFCAKCGTRQTAVHPAADPLSGISPRTASILCYLPFVGWIASIVVLASSAFRSSRAVRFNAFQGLYLFVAWLFVQWVFKPLAFFAPGPHFPFVAILQVALLGLSIFMMVKANQDEVFSLPVLGELAERSLSER